MGKLSATSVKAATRPGRHGDGDGFFLVIQASGAKSWVCHVQKNGSRRDLGAVFLRVYENALVRRTEAELIAQSTALAASASIIWPGAIEQPTPSSVRFEEPVTEVDLQSATVLPERPAPVRARMPIDQGAAGVLQRLKPVITQTKAVTLASIQLLDRNAIILNGYGMGGSLIHAPEVAAALRGKATTVFRDNASYRQTYPLEWLSRASVCVSIMPARSV